MMLDAAYDAYENYRVIRQQRQEARDRPAPRTIPSRATTRGQRCSGGGQENPEEFERTYHRRSLVESVFSSLKARFGAVVAAKTLPLQRLQLILRSICYNLLS